MLREKKKNRKKICNVSAPELGVAYLRPEIQMGDANRFDESQGECEDANMDLGDMLGELKRWVTLI